MISTFCSSANFFASLFGFTLKPIKIAFDAFERPGHHVEKEHFDGVRVLVRDNQMLPRRIELWRREDASMAGRAGESRGDETGRREGDM